MDDVYPDPFGGEPAPDLSTVDALIVEVERQADLLTAVATGGPRIQDVQAEYQDRRQRLVYALQRRGLEYPFPWQDLWLWYGHWTRNLGTYAERRAAIRELVAPTIDSLERQRSGLTVTDPGGGRLTWADLDGRVAGLSTELAGAASRDDLQDVGRRAREILIDCAQLLADPTLLTAGQAEPKAGDAKAWLDLFLTARIREPSRRAAPVHPRGLGAGPDRDPRRHQPGRGLRGRAGDRAGRADAPGARGGGSGGRSITMVSG